MMLVPLILLTTTAWTIKSPTESIPFRQPQLAQAHGQVAMAFGGGSSIYFASSPDGGLTFDAPVKVAETGALALGRHRGPRLLILKDAMLISAIAGQKVATGPHAHGLPDNGDLAVWRSTDKGKTWAKASVVNDVPGAAREGLHAISADAKGKITAVWLDLRAAGTQLYGAQSSDGGKSWSKNELVYSSPSGTICQCCHPSIATDEKNGLWVMWRNVLDGSRDMHLIHAAEGMQFREVRKLGEGTWKINACPMDGGGLVVSANGKITTAWRRESELFLEESGKPEVALGPGKDIAIAKGKAGIYAAWTKDGAVVVREPGATEPRAIGPDGGFATLLPLADGRMLAAWESRGAIETLRLQ